MGRMVVVARAALVLGAVLLARTAGAQCLGDFDGNFKVEINELVISVNNALNDCAGAPTPSPTPPGGACPIDFSDDNTQDGTPDCLYAGPFNQDCGGNDLPTRWISDGQIVIVQVLDLNTDVFFAADVRSANMGDLFGWFTKTDLSDLEALSGTVVLGEGGRTLVVAPCTSPFRIDNCDFVHYEGTLTDVLNPPAALRAGGAARLDPGAFSRLHERRALGPTRRNLQRR